MRMAAYAVFLVILGPTRCLRVTVISRGRSIDLLCDFYGAAFNYVERSRTPSNAAGD